MKTLGRWWCRMFHARPMWPIHGRYICAVCLREQRVAWEAKHVER
jgi:hypothetical protein